MTDRWEIQKRSAIFRKDWSDAEMKAPLCGWGRVEGEGHQQTGEPYLNTISYLLPALSIKISVLSIESLNFKLNFFIWSFYFIFFISICHAIFLFKNFLQIFREK